MVFCLHDSDSTKHWVRPQNLASWSHSPYLTSRIVVPVLVHICHFIPSHLYTLVFCNSWNINKETMYFIHVLVVENKQIFHNRCASVNKRKFAPWTRYHQFTKRSESLNKGEADLERWLFQQIFPLSCCFVMKTGIDNDCLVLFLVQTFQTIRNLTRFYIYGSHRQCC